MLITPLDIIIYLILGFFTFKGFKNGFIKEIGRIISFITSFIISSNFHQILIPYIEIYILEDSLQVAIAYLIIFFSVIIIMTLIINILQKFIEFVFLGWLNRLLGLLLGLLKGLLIISLIIFIIQAIPLKFDELDTIRSKIKNDSFMYQICNNLKKLIISTAPIKNNLNSFEKIRETISNEEIIQKKLKSLNSP